MWEGILEIKYKRHNNHLYQFKFLKSDKKNAQVKSLNESTCENEY